MEFWREIRQFLSCPTFEDPELDRQSFLLYATLKPTFLVTLLLLVVRPILHSPPMVSNLAMIMLGAEAGVFLLLKIGQARAGSVVLVGLGWCATVLPAFLQGGLASPFVWFTMLWVVVCGMLLDLRSMLGMLVLNIVTILIMWDTPDMRIPDQLRLPEASPERALLVLLLILYMVYSLIRISLSKMNEAFENVRLSQVELIQTNSELRSAREELEARVAERTADLERRGREMQASSEVVRTIASIRDLDALLNEITHLLSEQFGFYHAAVFLMDENKQLVMRAANTQVAQELVQKNFSVSYEQTSMVTTACRTRKPYLAADVSKDPIYLAMPEFPDTRSELALPLVAGERVLGALDLQSTSLAAFSPQDLGILQTLANQITIAIENADLFTENQAALESLQRAYGSLSQEGWQRLLRAEPNLGYRIGPLGRPKPIPAAEEAQDGWPVEMTNALKNGQVVQADAATLAVPIKIRDQATGVIRLRKAEENSTWIQAEINLVETLSDRLSTALESARLYEETRRRAERERLTGEITARMRTSNDPQAILQIAARELRKALQADKAQLVVQAVPATTLQPEASASGPQEQPEPVRDEKQGASTDTPQQGGKA